MGKASRLATAGVVALSLIVLAVAAPAWATTVSDRQVTPGVHERTIWDQTQVTIRKLPTTVNHYGTIHVELYFKNYAADLDLYVLNQDGDVVSDTGYLGSWLGWEAADVKVTDIAASPTTVGDTYYVVVVAFKGASEYFLWGYYPRLLDPEWSSDPAGAQNYYLEIYNYPLDGWAKITGPSLGTPYGFKPTSIGTVGTRLEWPADLASLTVKPDLSQGLMPAWFQQFVYSARKDYVVDEGTWAPPLHEEDPLDSGDDWYGLYDEFDTGELWDTVGWPQELMRYAPSLYMAYADPVLGPDGAPKTGRTTMGFKATLTWPENLWLRKVVKYSSYYKIYGAYSLDGARVPGGTKIYIERKTATRDWAVVKTVYTNDLGGWNVTLSPGVKWWVRARAAGNGAGGLVTEYSVSKVLYPL
ncbi:MAG: hypothetical protein JW767_05380 [Thermoleophilia bacterium]|nr:hypothetical protein [Thermoleophilia bacterium]